MASIDLRDELRWITYSLDGRYAYPSTGDVIGVKTRKIVAGVTDDKGAAVQGEKLLVIDFAGGRSPASRRSVRSGPQSRTLTGNAARAA